MDTTRGAHRTVGEAVADPTSNISRNLAKADAVRGENEKVIAAWMATGLTREQAWEAAIKATRG